MEGLQQGGSSGERVGNFVGGVKTEKFPPGQSASMAGRVRQAAADFEKGLEDDVNTAQALAAVFDLVRDVNTAIDRGEFRQGDAPQVLAAMQEFDSIFSLLVDEDAAKLRALGFDAAAGPEEA